MRRLWLARIGAVVAAGALAAPAGAGAQPPPENWKPWWQRAGATWDEEWIRSGDGTRLHADVFRPASLGPEDRTPVVLTVTPFNTAGGSATPGAVYAAAGIFPAGYTLVTVNLRGYGGSEGCGDLGGPGEQADVEAAVEWAASQRWSTGRVGMWGHSYDAWTGIMALATRPKGLAAVIADAPVTDPYRVVYTNRNRHVPKAYEMAAFAALYGGMPLWGGYSPTATPRR